MNERGSTSVVILGMLLLLSVLFIGGSVFVELTLRNLRRSQTKEHQREVLREINRQAVQRLLEDPTPTVDSPLDPIWDSLLDLENDGISVELEDASSRMGLNWVRKELIQSLGVLQPGKTAQELQQFREDTGIHLNLKREFAGFVDEDTIGTLFTPYTYFNINISDEFVLRKLYAIRSLDSAAAEVFHTRIQSARAEKKIIAPEDLADFLGPGDYSILFPVANAEPAMNIHFAPEPILTALFSHYQVPPEKIGPILSLRESAEWTAEDIEDLIGEKYSETLLHQYLGVKTWFWKIVATGDDLTLSWIVARVPGPEETEVELRLIEEIFGL